jgi:hypothetical protein
MRCDRQDVALFVLRETLIQQLPAEMRVLTDHEMSTRVGRVGADLVIQRAGARGAATVIVLGGDHVGRVTRLSALERSGAVPCSWRIELDRHPSYRGPVPVIFVRMLRSRAWHERFYFGRSATIPLCIAEDSGECTQLVTLRLDPRDVAPTHGLGLLPSEEPPSS